MTDKELNDRLEAIDLENRITQACTFGILEPQGKCLPYLGLHWHYINFSNINGQIVDCRHIEGGFVAFCAINRWNYPTLPVRSIQAVNVRAMMEAVVEDTCRETCIAIFNYLQSMGPRQSPRHVNGHP